MSSPNQQLIEELQVILDEAKMSNTANDRFRIKSYKDAIEKIKAVTHKINNDSEIPLAKTSKIYAKVKEFIEKGQIHQSQKILAESEGLIDIYRDLQKIAEIGPAKAKLLVEDYGIRSIEQLAQNIDLLNDKQKIGFKYWKTDQLRIPRDEILKHKKICCSLESLRDVEDFEKFDIIGLAGSMSCDVASDHPAWHLMSDRSQHVGEVSHSKDGKTWTTCFGPTDSRALVIDGLFIGVNVNKALETGLLFNELFGFHHYDITFSLEANKLKIKTGVFPLSVVHFGTGSSMNTDDWRESAKKFKNLLTL